MVQPRLSVSIQVPSSACGESPVEILGWGGGSEPRCALSVGVHKCWWKRTALDLNGWRRPQHARRCASLVEQCAPPRHHFRVSATNWVGATASASVDITPDQTAGGTTTTWATKQRWVTRCTETRTFVSSSTTWKRRRSKCPRAEPRAQCRGGFPAVFAGRRLQWRFQCHARTTPASRGQTLAPGNRSRRREANRVRGSRAVSERSWKRFGEAAGAAVGTRGCRLARPRGDFMTSQKRVLVLLVLLLNSATVCALLVDTDQRLPFLSPGVSAAVVACALAFPVPFSLATFSTAERPRVFASSLSQRRGRGSVRASCSRPCARRARAFSSSSGPKTPTTPTTSSGPALRPRPWQGSPRVCGGVRVCKRSSAEAGRQGGRLTVPAAR